MKCSSCAAVEGPFLVSSPHIGPLRHRLLPQLARREETMFTRRTVAVLAVLAVSLVAAPAAAAGQPTHTRTDDIHIDQFDTTSCAFPFREIADGFVNRTVFVDEDGTPTRVRIIASFDGVAINEANGKTAQLDQVLVIFVDLETGEVVWDGLRIKATMPGGGALLLDVGRIIFDASGTPIFEAGRHQVIHEDFEDFCTAMS
jgi:hypothetical protein